MSQPLARTMTHSFSPSTPKTTPEPTTPETMSQTTLFVCTTCGITWDGGRRIGKSGGEKLLDRLHAQLQAQAESAETVSLRSVECMSACDRGCVVSLCATGKFTYLFGNLPADDDRLNDVSQALLDIARCYDRTEDGTLRWSERPPLLKKRAIAQIPPVLPSPDPAES